MDNKKLKVYLDTSVISYLWHMDAFDKMQETLELWEKFRNEKFDVYLSQLTLEEINKCNDEKRQKLSEYLNEIKFTNLNLTEEAVDIGNQIIEFGILKDKSRDDANHIGVAVANGLDFIISWNFRHMVNIKTVNGVRAITNLRNGKIIEIVTPTYFLGEE